MRFPLEAPWISYGRAKAELVGTLLLVFLGGWALEQLWLSIVAPLLGTPAGASLGEALFAAADTIEAAASAVAAEPS